MLRNQDSKVISDESLDKIVDNAIIKEAEERNAELGFALKHISEKELKDILNDVPWKKPLKSFFRERLIWISATAAILAVAISLPIITETNARHDIDNLVYSYNIPRVQDMTVRASRGETMEFSNLSSASEDVLKEYVPKLEEQFRQAQTMQDISLYGQALALVYIRLHERGKAKTVLNDAISKLSTDSDYADNAADMRKILSEIE